MKSNDALPQSGIVLYICKKIIMIYYTSDWHLGEDRIGINGKPNVFFRNFKSVAEEDNTILNNFRKKFKDGDTLIHVGDVIYNMESSLKLVQLFKEYPNSTFELIIGNYDEDKLDFLRTVFDTVERSGIVKVKGREYYINHYPENCIEKDFSICGHIHGLWKVQKNMINVGVDAWHYEPVSEDQIDFARTGCEKHYDKNVFPY